MLIPVGYTEHNTSMIHGHEMEQEHSFAAMKRPFRRYKWSILSKHRLQIAPVGHSMDIWPLFARSRRSFGYRLN